ncbi:MAG TPA: phosphohydrolase, partial [Ktedonobacter sp.]|nr:phosphohydrolase [Ktedonobacter sp.]
MAGRLFSRMEALFWNANRRRRVEQLLSAERARTLEMEIADNEVLFDLPRP